MLSNLWQLFSVFLPQIQTVLTWGGEAGLSGMVFMLPQGNLGSLKSEQSCPFAMCQAEAATK